MLGVLGLASRHVIQRKHIAERGFGTKRVTTLCRYTWMIAASLERFRIREPCPLQVLGAKSPVITGGTFYMPMHARAHTHTHTHIYIYIYIIYIYIYRGHMCVYMSVDRPMTACMPDYAEPIVLHVVHFLHATDCRNRACLLAAARNLHPDSMSPDLYIAQVLPVV